MISKYLWRIIVPYFLLAWLLLTTILFLQQGARFAEILLGVNVPWRYLLELSAALILTVAAFTSPMALLVGIVVAFGQLRGDSETAAMAAGGIGPGQLVKPCLLLGALISCAALWVNWQGVPLASQIVRRVTVETALLKLESPIEPGVFNTQFNNYVIYVRDGNNEAGIWERVFIYLPKGDQIQLITAASGRIDAAEDKSELVLNNAQVTTLPARGDGGSSITNDQIGALRLTLETGRRALRQKLTVVERVSDEMGFEELWTAARAKTGREQIELLVLFNRRLALSIAPLILAMLGAAISLRLKRGGRGGAIVVALAAILVYYLLSLLGEQLARNQTIPLLAGCWAANFLTVCVSSFWLFRATSLSKRRLGDLRVFQVSSFFGRTAIERDGLINRRHSRVNGEQSVWESRRETRLLGLLERDLWKNLLWYFALTCFALLLLFEIFTLLEVVRSFDAATMGYALLFKYLLLLCPFVLWQIAPTALMLAALTTYAIKARRSETVVWESAGQSLSTMLLPCLLFAIALGALNWQWQEKVLPITNPQQDSLRARLRGSTVAARDQENRVWLKINNDILTFTAKNESDNVEVKDFAVYHFDDEGRYLSELQRAEKAVWQNPSIELSGVKTEVDWQGSLVQMKRATGATTRLSVNENPFATMTSKTQYLSFDGLQKLRRAAESASEQRRLEVLTQIRLTTLLLPLVIILFTAPLALKLSGRRGQIGRSIGLTVIVWLLLTATINLFGRLGDEGVLPPLIAVWSPLVLFGSLGCYWLAKLRG